MAERVRAAAPGTLLIAESDLNDPRVIRPPAQGGWGLDAQWADDFHHALHALLTGERDGYYADVGRIGDLAATWRRPYLRPGEYSPSRRRRHGAPADDRPPSQFVVCAQNHDQVGNRAAGDRLPREVRRVAAFCVALSPFTPLVFMGEESGEDRPFLYFTDHDDPRIAAATREGRRREFAAFAELRRRGVPDPRTRGPSRARSCPRGPRPRRCARSGGTCSALRRRLGRAEAEVLAVDEDAARCGCAAAACELCLNLSPRPARVPPRRAPRSSWPPRRPSPTAAASRCRRWSGAALG